MRSYCWTFIHLSHLEIRNGTKVCKYYTYNNKHMPNLMTMPTQIKSPGVMSFRTPTLIHKLPYRINVQSKRIRYHDTYVERNARNEGKRIAIIKKGIINDHMGEWHNVSKPKSPVYESLDSLMLRSMHPFEH